MQTYILYMLITYVVFLAAPFALLPHRLRIKDDILFIVVACQIFAAIAALVLSALIWRTDSNTYLPGKIFLLVGSLILVMSAQFALLGIATLANKIGAVVGFVSVMAGTAIMSFVFVAELAAPATDYESEVQTQVLLADLASVLGDNYPDDAYAISLGSIYVVYDIVNHEPHYISSAAQLLQGDLPSYTVYLVKPYKIVRRENHEQRVYVDEPYEKAVLELPLGVNSIISVGDPRASITNPQKSP